MRVAVHSSHRIGHTVRSGTRRHIVGVEGSSGAAAARYGEVGSAVLDTPFFISAAYRMLETSGVSGVTGDTRVDFFHSHYSDAFVYVVRAVATYFCSFAVTISGFFNDGEGVGVLVVFGLYVSEAVYSADDISRVFS